MSRRRSALFLFFFFALPGCPNTHTPDGDAGADAGHTPADTGVDAAATDGGADTGADAGPRADAGIVSCDPMDAAIDPCGTPCFAVTSAFWDGASCVPAHCDCVGDDCNEFTTVEACEAAHAGCDATLCASTGGAWFNRPEWCGHFECGRPGPMICESPTRACDCGTYRVFMDGVGCVDGPLCELVAPLDPAVRCESTGGEWRNDVCGSAMCGRASSLPCVMPGCVCGELEIFDADRGCIRSPSCEVRMIGESCAATSLCDGGGVCCTGGAGGRNCEAPQCDSPDGVCGPPRP